MLNSVQGCAQLGRKGLVPAADAGLRSGVEASASAAERLYTSHTHATLFMSFMLFTVRRYGPGVRAAGQGHLRG